jgi:hypothetical protein
MIIQEMIDRASLARRCAYDRYTVVYPGPMIYKDDRLLLAIRDGTVVAFQAWIRSDAVLINAALLHLGLIRYHCTWSGDNPHMVEYDESGGVLHAEDPVSMIRRLN